MKLSRRKVAALAFALLVLTFRADESFASEGILLSNVPRGATKPQLIAIIQQAFLNRQWSVTKTDESSVTAKLDHRSYDSEMTISISGNTLTYFAASTFTEKSHIQAGMIGADRKLTRDVPSAWILNLRKDISQTVSAIPSPDTTGGTASAQNPAERLKALENLRNSGLITDQEYTQKRQAIIEAL